MVQPKMKHQKQSCSTREVCELGSDLKPKTKEQIKNDKIVEITRLGKEFPIFLDFDENENVRRAIVEFNFKSKNKKITDDELDYVLKCIDVDKPPEGSEKLKVVNNKQSRRCGLSHLLGRKGFEVVSRDSTVMGTIIGMAKNVLGYY